MTQTEALKLALEGAANYIDVLGGDSKKYRQLLAQQNAERVSNEQVEPVAWRWPYKFKDIGETGAYEYHSHEFACLAHLPKGEPLYTHPPVPYVVEPRMAQPKDFEAYCKTLHPLWNTRISRTEAEGFFHAGWLVAQPKEPEQEPNHDKK